MGTARPEGQRPTGPGSLDPEGQVQTAQGEPRT